MMLSASGFVLALAMVSWAQVKVLPTHTVTIAGTVETIDHTKAPGVAHLVLEAPTTATQNREFAIVAEV